MLKLPEYLKELRGKKSIRAVAKGTGISNAYLSQLESRDRESPHPDVLKKLAKFYNMPVLQFFNAAGYLDKESSAEETYEQKIDREYLKAVRNHLFNPAMTYLQPKDVSLEIKKFIIDLHENFEMLRLANHWKLVKDMKLK